MASGAGKVIAANKKAYHDYFILDRFEAGIELCGTEVKSLRKSGANLKDSWCMIKNGEIFANNIHISPYEQGNIFNRDPYRVRRLLMHKKEIMKLFGKAQQQSLTIIPLSLYFKGSHIKAEIGLCKGKKIYDKRDVESKKQSNLDIQRTLKERNR